jgi:hypothetical protein
MGARFVSFTLFLTVVSVNERRKQRIYIERIFTFPQLIFHSAAFPSESFVYSRRRGIAN